MNSAAVTNPERSEAADGGGIVNATISMPISSATAPGALTVILGKVEGSDQCGVGLAKR